MDYIDTKHVAAELRNRMKNAFPGVKFSVRKGTGTASAWISVNWTDGPDTAEVEESRDQQADTEFMAAVARCSSTSGTACCTSARATETSSARTPPTGPPPREVRSGCASRATATPRSDAHQRVAPQRTL